nr:multiple epidermal growth factor-like domains protein 10 isoform X2 [Crassostrea gigas]
MSSKHVFGFTIVIPLLLYLYLNNWTKGALAECVTNFCKDGNDCKECPAGYYGDNCSAVCPPSHYGIRCVQKCDCLPCHRVYGCFSTPFAEETTSIDYETRTIKEDKTQAPENKLTTFSRIIIIFSVGSVLCILLIFVIIRELWLCCQLSQPSGIRGEIVDVYADIAERDSVRED